MINRLFWVLLLPGIVSAQQPEEVRGTINPNGIFFNRFTGGFDGTEWFQTIPIAGQDRFIVADIFGGGFSATITPDGQITLDNGVGAGSFSDNDNYVITPNIGGTAFTFTCNRAPFTTTGFPLQLDSPRPANPLFDGAWNNVLESINPETGVIAAPAMEELTISTSGNTLRITDPAGLFFQGVFENALQVGFRRIEPEPGDPRFGSFAGSDINFNQNLLGEVVFSNINEFVGLFLLQSRTPLGSQTQQLFRFTVTRADPLPQGDLNGDREVNAVDRNLLVNQLGLTIEDDNFNLAGDLNLDGVVNMDDLVLFDGDDVVFISGFE